MPRVRTSAPGSRTKWAEQSKLVSSHLWGLKTKLSISAAPSIIQRCSSSRSALPAQAASTCRYSPCSRQIRPIGRSGSIAPTPVVPRVATTPAGTQPLVRSSRIIAASASGRRAKASSVGTRRSAAPPSPAIRIAFSTDEWASSEA